MAAQAVRKRLVVCVDGTYCTPDGTGVHAALRGSLTNVYSIFACVKEAEVTDKHGQRWMQERKYYNGLGALTKPGVSKLNAGAWGTGFKELIREVYGRCCELSEHDELWLYGFSRGAFVVRAVAGLLHYIRKLKATGTTAFHKHFETALNAYASVQGEGRLGTGQINHLFKVGTVPAPTIRFLGLFDTVKAVKDNGLFNIAPNPSIQHIRHALALHEDRERFTPEYIWPEESVLAEMIRSGRSLVQAWFAGAHLDIGGSALEAGLALYPLQWMMIESRDLGLQLEFHGNVPNAPHIDDPLMLVFPPTEAWGKTREMWSCTVDNRLELKMQDLRAVHVLHRMYSTRYKIKINRDGFHFWVRKPRSIFKAPENCTKDGSAAATLLGYCASMPLGTVIHPSVYCLIDSNINLIMETKQGELVQYLSEWSGRMLGEVDLKFGGVTKRIPNPGFWNSDDHNEKDLDLPPLRILVCGYVGVGKSTLVGRVFGVDSSTVSERTRGVHNINDEVRIPGRNDFILHDSNGFEGGSAGELEAVQQFVRERVEENDLRKQLHVIWFCVETGSPRVVQRATESFFLAMAECQRHVPVVVVATKKDAFVNQIIGKMAQGGADIKLCNMIAEEKLREEAGHIEALVTAIPGARVDAVVCVEQNDPKSIAELTTISSSVFQDEKTRLMYVKAQMARPDLKMHMAIYQVMKRYKHAVGTAVATVNLPFGATGSRQGSKDDICKRIINCFGVQDLNTSKALKIMQSNIKDGMAEGLIMFWSEVLAAGGIACLVFGITAPVIIATAAIGTSLNVPSTARLFLCTAADLILILAKSFQFASLQDRTQPTISDVEASAKAFSNYAQEIHDQICILLPRNNVFRSFSFGKIQARFEALIDEYWHKIVTDSVHAARVTNTSHSAARRTTTTTLSSSSSLSLSRKVSDTHSISSQSENLTTATTLSDAKPRPDDNDLEQTPPPRPKRFWRRFSKG